MAVVLNKLPGAWEAWLYVMYAGRRYAGESMKEAVRRKRVGRLGASNSRAIFLFTEDSI